jgi:hypothetical protein
MIESSSLVQSLERTGRAIVAMAPDLLLALVLLIAGWLVAKLVRRLVIRMLRSLRVDDLAERAGFEDFLIQGGVQVTTVTLIGNTIYWLILAGVFVALLDALGMRTAGALLERMVLFLPNLVLAVGILVFGSLLARVVGALVFSYLSNIGSRGRRADCRPGPLRAARVRALHGRRAARDPDRGARLRLPDRLRGALLRRRPRLRPRRPSLGRESD